MRKPVQDFTAGEWEQAARSNSLRGKCRACALRGQDVKICSGTCGQVLPVASYTKWMWALGDGNRKCLRCMDRNKRGYWDCVECKTSKDKSEYSLWLSPRKTKKNNGTARCNDCQRRQSELQESSLRDSVAHVAKKARR